ncbi:MAG: hypothetical protein Q4A16_08755 [Lautropia sp.]|nr:hypothetical protein [Lautropia sp.]
MSFPRLLARLAAQILLGIAGFLWMVIAILDPNRADVRPIIIIGAVCCLAALLRLGKSGRWVPWAGAIGMILPIGALAHVNGASPWIWILWAAIIAATERWIRDGHMVPMQD